MTKPVIVEMTLTLTVEMNMANVLIDVLGKMLPKAEISGTIKPLKAYDPWKSVFDWLKAHKEL